MRGYPMNEASVLICGAGIAGPTLAFWLRAAGFRPTVVEQAPAVRSGGYVIDFWGLGYDIAEQMGLLDELNCGGYHMRELRIVGERGQRITGFGADVFRELTNGRFVTVRRSDLSRLLFERARAGAEFIFDEEIAGLKELADGVEVRFKRGSERRFDLVIGADGLHSNIRQQVFGPQDRFEFPLGYVVAAFEVEGYRPRDELVYVMGNEPGRMLARFAMRDDRTLFLFVFAADSDQLPPAHDLEAQKGVLRERYGGMKWEASRILDELDRTQDLYLDRVSQIRMPNWSKGRIALVGDAAFCVSLMAGQGSALAMTAAYVLAGELAKSGGSYEEAFRNYEELLRSFIASKQRGAVGFCPAFAPKTQWGLFLRNQVIRLMALPGLARFTIGRDIIDSLELPEYRWPRLELGGSPVGTQSV